MYSAGIGELYPRRGVVPAKKYRIELTREEQQELKALVLNQIRIGRDRGDGVCVWRLGQ